MLWKVAPREKGLHTLGGHGEVAATTSTMNPNPNPNPKILHNSDNNNNHNIDRSNVNVGSLYGTLDDGCGVKVEGNKGGKGDDDKSYRVGVIIDPIQKSEPKHHPNTGNSKDDNIQHIINDTILDSGADNDTLAGIHKHKYNNIHGVDNIIMKGINGSS